VSLFKRQCSWPGCEARGKRFFAGKCSRHGSWAGCERHTRGYGYRGISAPRYCPLCTWERPETQDPLEAARRNAAEREATERHFAQYAAEFRAQGYGEAAADAMASKRFAEEGPQPREWSSLAIKQERELAEFQRKRRAGEVGRCPACNMYAPVSEGVILGHTTKDSSLEPSGCGGVGMLAEVSES